MKIDNTYISTLEVMNTFGVPRNWLFRKGSSIRRIEKVEKGRNKIYYCVEDIQKEILRHENHKTEPNS